MLRYTVEKQLEIAEPYGEVVEVGQVPGQIGFFPLCGPFKCTGEQKNRLSVLSGGLSSDKL